MYLYLLIFCGIWSQRIIGTFADEEIKESSDFPVRQKRVVSYEEGEAKVVGIEERPYIAHIIKYNHVFCVGTILSHRTVLTTTECAQYDAQVYKVLTKSAISNRGTVHNVTNIKVHKDNLHSRFFDGISLFTIDPPIVYGLFVKNIQLYVRPLVPGMIGTISGWGFNFGRSNVHGTGTSHPVNLRTIEVPIILHQDCVNIYRNYYPITEKDICTFHPQRHCGYTDSGAPLVINNLLVGIFLRSGPSGYRYNCEYPEVFALLQHSYYRDWIRANI